MNSFQVVFLASLIIFLIIVARSKTVIVERGLTLIILLGGALFVIFPNYATVIANLVGIGRGADLIFYIYIFLTLIWFVTVSMKLRRTERKLTRVIRSIAISTPQFGPDFRDSE